MCYDTYELRKKINANGGDIMNKSEKLTELKSTIIKAQAEIERLESNPERFAPETNYSYYFVQDSGSIGKIKNERLFFKDDCFKNFNCYETAELATKAAVMMKRSNAIIMACLLVDPDFVPDFNNSKQCKYFISQMPGRFGDWACSVSDQTVNFGPCVSTEKKFKKVAAFLTVWGVK